MEKCGGLRTEEETNIKGGLDVKQQVDEGWVHLADASVVGFLSFLVK